MKRVSIRTINLFFLIFVVAYIGLSYLAAVFLAGVQMPEWMLFVISDAVLITPVAVFLMICRVNPLKMECMRLTRISNLVASVVYAYALMPLMLLLNMITMTFTENAANDMIEVIAEYPVGLQLLLMAIMPAILEELVFRGVFREPYRKRNILGAACMSGIIFGVIHMNINQCAYAMAIGIAFSLLVEASNSILCSIMAHFAINASSVLLSAVAMQAQGMEEYMEQTEEAGYMMQETGLPWILYLYVLAFVVGGIAIAIVVLRGIARRSGRLEYMTEELHNGFLVKDKDTTKFVDVYFLGALAIGIAFMILNL